ncbi:geranylgeranyl diphosphate synthase, type I [Saccharopolyspora antimicrobica]|uniref:Farnesyl-diphosphate synthase /geranylgeranyl-diphosphate synthase n=1 Tax=Saccharopolyspora antimicrobica TaxID=455193 RepID=A0A1I5CPQ4_9PSEU|nr:polyprenyl synthetase family protein [Saccharopolyspora antimicrobica]RKT88791.1 farnesyl-diphosphate synthase /geranylgeranyl-diphosphate synthase [Saccharopolyspora antimicrobica]SFN88938.1 geranylgeranyl diphosphate synthase, type I [Saccharopolyspora antimicrobica]
MTFPATARTDHELGLDAIRRARELTEPVLRELVDRLGPSLGDVGRYHFGWRSEGCGSAGKAIRPTMAVLAAEAVGAEASAAVPAAAAVELVHNFSLIHDDIIDNDELRRGRRAVWKEYGVPEAILIGDALHSEAFGVLLSSGRPNAAAAAMRLSTAMREVVVGQVDDIRFTERPWTGEQAVSVAEYQAMAEAKTGALLAFSAAAGALLGGASEAVADCFDRLGRHLGLAFQCTDDVLGIWGDPENTGKPVFGDLREGKRTLPVIAALSAGGSASERLGVLVERGVRTDFELRLAAELVAEAGGREFAEREAARHLAEVDDCLTALSMPAETRACFNALSQSLIGRTR